MAAWILHLRGLGAPVNDAQESRVRPLVEGSLEDAVGAVLRDLGVEDAEVERLVLAQAQTLESLAAR